MAFIRIMLLGLAICASIYLTVLTTSAPRISNDWARLDSLNLYIPQEIDYRWSSYWIQAGLWVFVAVMLLALGAIQPRLHPSTQRGAKTRRVHLWSVAALTLLGFGLRLYSWNQLPLIIDEIGFAAHASDILHGQRVPILAPGHNANASFYSVLVAASMRVWGQDVFAVRIIPAVFGTLTIPAMYALGREWWSPRMGLLAAVFVTTFPAHVFFSRISVYNNVEPFFSTLALVLVVRAMRTGQVRVYVMAGVMAALAQHLYHGSRLLLVLIGIYVFIDASRDFFKPWTLWKGRLIGLGWMAITLLLLALPQVVVLAANGLPITGNIEPLRLPADIWQNVLRAWRAWIGQPDVSSFWLSHRPLLLFPAMIAFLLGVLVSIKRWRDPRHAVLLVSPILTTIFGGAILTAAPLFIRYITAVAAIALLVSVGIETLNRWRRLGDVLLLLICVQGIWIARWEHPSEAYDNITPSQWIEDDLAQQTIGLPPETSVLLLVPADFHDIQMITIAHYVAVYDQRRPIAVNRSDPARLAAQLERLPLPVIVIEALSR